MQLALHFQQKSEPDEELARLCLLLKENKGWHSATQIKAALGYNERLTRKLASNSHGLIISAPGSPGYKHLHHCTAEEISTITGKLLAQAKSMADRSGQISTAWHSQLSSR